MSAGLCDKPNVLNPTSSVTYLPTGPEVCNEVGEEYVFSEMIDHMSLLREL